MYHKVFINNVEIVFSETPILGYTSIPTLPENHDLETWIDTLRALPLGTKYVIVDSDEEQWNAFLARHAMVYAAGGLVTNKHHELLLIKRLGFWDLPKGKMEAGETPEVCAVREVQEECGIEHLELVAPLESTYHTYLYKGKNVLKKTYWFAMMYKGESTPSPQIEEDITEVCFKSPEEVIPLRANTYPSLFPLFDAYLSRNK